MVRLPRLKQSQTLRRVDITMPLIITVIDKLPNPYIGFTGPVQCFVYAVVVLKIKKFPFVEDVPIHEFPYYLFPAGPRLASVGYVAVVAHARTRYSPSLKKASGGTHYLEGRGFNVLTFRSLVTVKAYIAR